ncbi:MAG TPA: periplasmic heavy metal sensor [Caulobacteraceae bacterium]
MALPPGPRQDFAAAVKAVNVAQRANSQAIRQLRLEAWTALGAEKVDAPAIKAKLDQARVLEMGVRSKVDGAVVDFTATLPQPQRALVAQEMRPQPQLQQQPDAPAASSPTASPSAP